MIRYRSKSIVENISTKFQKNVLPVTKIVYNYEVIRDAHRW